MHKNKLIQKYSMLLLQTTIVVLCFVGIIYHAKATWVLLPIDHVDGAFQTANGLFRLDNGMLPGKDFFPYLGIGPIFVLFPFFEWFGADLAASGIAAVFVVFILLWLTLGFIWQLIFKPKKPFNSIVAAAVCLIIFSFTLPGQWIVNLLGYEPPYLPLPSIRPVRASIVYFIAALYYFWLMKIQKPRLKYFLCGLVVGIVPLWSNDYAVPTFGLFVLLVGYDAIKNKTFNTINSFIFIFTALSASIIFFSLATAGHPLAMLKYNFHDVLPEQWWYPFPYSDQGRLYGLKEAVTFFMQNMPQCIVTLGIYLVTWLAYFKYRTRELLILVWIGSALLAGGLLPCTGGYVNQGYFSAFNYFEIFTALIFICCLIYILLKKSKRIDKKTASIIGLVACLFLSAYYANKQSIILNARKIFAKNSTELFYVPELGGYLPQEWQDYVQLAREHTADTTVEEYWGIWSAIQHRHSPWPVDIIIHALGDVREIAKSKLSQVNTIITTKSTVTGWQQWGISQNYWFYKELFEHWQPTFLSPMTVIWKKRQDTPQPWPTVQCNIENSLLALNIETNEPGFYEIRLHYKILTPHRSLVIVLNQFITDWALFKSNNSSAPGVSLPLNMTEYEFPVRVEHAGTARFDILSFNLPIQNVELLGCKSRKILFRANGVLQMQ